jgi:large subunit ribosomal protein L31
MKQGIHPDYNEMIAICACGEVFYTGSVKKSDALRLDVCGACHPFYTGKQKAMDTGGRIDRFKSKVAAKTATPKKKTTTNA